MHCPKCGQQQVSDEIRFCSRCGFLLTGIAEVVAHDGVVPHAAPTGTALSSPRKRGLKQGLFIFLLAFLVVPIIAILTMWVNAEPIAVAISAILLFVGGLLRMVYALMFEESEPDAKALEAGMKAAKQNFFQENSANAALPPQPASMSDYVSPKAGSWRDTNELQDQPRSVTEGTTRLLEKED